MELRIELYIELRAELRIDLRRGYRFRRGVASRGGRSY
jgi:hypothetical protein